MRFGNCTRGRKAASRRWWAEESQRDGPRTHGRLGAVGGTGEPRRPAVAAALDVQEHATSGAGVDSPGPHSGGNDRSPIAERSWLQLAGQPQDARRRKPSGPGCAISVHQSPSCGPTTARPAGSLGRYQEERNRGKIEESWAKLAAEGTTA